MCRPSTVDNKIKGPSIQAVVTIKLYWFGHQRITKRKKRWNDKEILVKINMETESSKGGNVAPLRHTILIPSQPVFAPTA